MRESFTTEKEREMQKSDFTPIPVADFQKRTGIDLARFPDAHGVELVISPRDIKRVLTVIVMPDDYRNQLLGSVGLVSDQERKVYGRLVIHQRMIDPNSLRLGQKFVYRKNYISIVESFRDTFKGFGIAKGFTRHLSCLIVGTDEKNRTTISHYLPPIIEQTAEGMNLMDGVHRSYLALRAGVSIDALVIEKVETPFPCTPHSWDDVKVAGTKPERAEDRFWDLDRGLFRNVKHIGIDG